MSMSQVAAVQRSLCLPGADAEFFYHIPASVKTTSATCFNICPRAVCRLRRTRHHTPKSTIAVPSSVPPSSVYQGPSILHAECPGPLVSSDAATIHTHHTLLLPADEAYRAPLHLRAPSGAPYNSTELNQRDS